MIKIIDRVSKNYLFVIFAIAGGLFFTSCDDNSTGENLGSLPDVTFSATPLSSNTNKIVVKSTTDDAFMWRWDFGNGSTSQSEIDTVTYINQGDYTLNLRAFGEGGSAATSKQVSIASDYQGENVLPNDGTLTAENWTYLNISGGGKVDVSYNDGAITFTNSSYSYGAIYQSVQVEAGTEYLFSAEVEGSGMGNESWFEVYFGTSQPVQGSDYTDNKFVSLNTYVPCGGSSFNGDLVDMSCSGNGSGNGGVITFSQTGPVYLVIKAGSNNGTLGEGGVTLTDVSLSKL